MSWEGDSNSESNPACSGLLLAQCAAQSTLDHPANYGDMRSTLLRRRSGQDLTQTANYIYW